MTRASSAVFRPLPVLTLLFLFVVAVALGGATGSYELSASGSVDVPDRTLTHEGTSYDVGSIAERSQGETLAISVSVPDGTSFHVDLYDADRTLVDDRSGSGSQQVTFDTENLAPGTYLLALYADGEYRAIHPLVVTGYDLSVAHDEEAPVDGTLAVTVDVTATTASGSPAAVEVIIWRGSTTEQATATETDAGEYVAELSLDGLAAGDYTVYAVAQGSDVVYGGQQELLGISGSNELTISEEATPDASTPSGGSGPAAPTPTPTDPEETNETETSSPATEDTPGTPADGTPAANDTPAETPSPTPTTEPTETPTDVDGTPTPTATPSDDGVITPNPATETPEPTPSAGQDLYTVQLVALLLALFACGARLRRLS